MQKKQEKNSKRPLSTTDASTQGVHTCIPSIDWLQMDIRGILKKASFLEWELQQFSTRHFSEIWQAKEKSWKIFEIVCKPKSDILPKDLHLIKLDNRECYYIKPVARIKKYIIDCNLNFKSVSRLDICLDFNTFTRNYLPENFIKNFMKGNYSCRKKRKGQTNFDHQDKIDYNYLRLQAKRSNIGVYLYNKSKEMRDVKKKNYIVNKWKACGLDTSKDIWRLEFSIHNAKFDFTDTESGETIPFNIDLLDDDRYLTNCIYMLIDNYFTFYQRTNTRARNCKKKVNLFNFKEQRFKILFRDESITTDRSDRIFLNKLQDLNNELRYAKRNEMEHTKEIIKYIKKTRNL